MYRKRVLGAAVPKSKIVLSNDKDVKKMKKKMQLGGRSHYNKRENIKSLMKNFEKLKTTNFYKNGKRNEFSLDIFSPEECLREGEIKRDLRNKSFKKERANKSKFPKTKKIDLSKKQKSHTKIRKRGLSPQTAPLMEHDAFDTILIEEEKVCHSNVVSFKHCYY
ncbi:hypothetical protein MHBO_001719 [Bonamia ostreae]|uniref:Uncharacterized protein n=1 Tax=Bonamia ostreae TaxID=126728 RepID=A0ABV2AJZ5_9EUKA